MQFLRGGAVRFSMIAILFTSLRLPCRRPSRTHRTPSSDRDRRVDLEHPP
jgi:hypothetical protein